MRRNLPSLLRKFARLTALVIAASSLPALTLAANLETRRADFQRALEAAEKRPLAEFAGIARAMGAEGIVVDKLEDVGAALKKAIDLQMNQGKTCVIEIMCTRELGDPFRRDALAKPVRLLEKYKDYV